MWLIDNGIGACWEIFREEQFTALSALFSLTSGDLKELGLRMGQSRQFMAGLDHLATYSNEQLTSMNMSTFEIKTFSIAAQKYLEKVISLHLLLLLI